MECLRGTYLATSLKTTPSLKSYQAAQARSSLAKLLEIDHKQLTYLLYKLTPAAKYKAFQVPKKNGGHREIHSPIKELKSLQRKLAAGLEACLSEIHAKPTLANNASHGFRPMRSILTNAANHRNKRYVFNVDLKDFFPSISAKRIRGFLIKDTNFAFHEDVATAIAHVACIDDKLPQGSPSSPVISNMIAGILDFHLSALAKKHGCRYTRYADDLTFSTNLKIFPKSIAVESEPNVWAIGRPLNGLIVKAGFEANPEKTRMQYKDSRQEVTGLVVNKRVSVPKEYRYKVRSYVNSLVNSGGFFIERKTKNEDGTWKKDKEDGTHAQLHGMLGFIHSVESIFRTDLREHPYNYPGINPPDKRVATGNLAIFRRFLLFTRFYANSQPLIICEGKTDNVYISNAVHQCREHVPSLLKKEKDKEGKEAKEVLAFQLLKYARKHHKSNKIYLPNFSTISILGGGSGGGANLAGLIRAYHKELPKFRADIGASPVIFIVDNDSGAKPVKSAISDTSKIAYTGSEPFVRIFANCYIVPIPLAGAKERSIEELFSAKDTGKQVGGRTFDFTKDGDTDTTLGKASFAYEYVAKQPEIVDWTGFVPLLQNIVAAIEDYNLNGAP